METRNQRVILPIKTICSQRLLYIVAFFTIALGFLSYSNTKISNTNRPRSLEYETNNETIHVYENIKINLQPNIRKEQGVSFNDTNLSVRLMHLNDSEDGIRIHKDESKVSNQNKENENSFIKNEETQHDATAEEKELDGSWLRNMTTRFKQRRNHLKEQCEKLQLSVPTSSSSMKNRFSWPPNRVAPKYHLLVCTINKAGSSTWNTHLDNLNGQPLNDSMENHIKERKAQLVGVNQSLPDPSAYTSVMTARHPLDRLVSAYKNKYRDGNQIVERYFANLAGRYLGKNNGTLENFSFKEFLRLVIKEREAEMKGEAKAEPHWKAVHRTMCSPCNHDYDYIMKVETFNEDISYIFRILGISDVEVNLQANNSALKKYSKSIPYEKYYEDIPDDMIRKIYQIYKEDFELFGYDVPSFVKKVL